LRIAGSLPPGAMVKCTACGTVFAPPVAVPVAPVMAQPVLAAQPAAPPTPLAAIPAPPPPAALPAALPLAAVAPAPAEYASNDPFDSLGTAEPSSPLPRSSRRDRLTLRGMLKSATGALGPRGMMIALTGTAGVSVLLIALVIWWGLGGFSKSPGSVAQGAQGTGTNPTSSAEPNADGSLNAQVLRNIKAATVYIHVTSSTGGSSGEGSGFFEKESGMIVTNAHVVDMLDSDAPPPGRIEIVFFHGTPREVRTGGSVAGVDRESDLALIQLEPTNFRGPAPERLSVSSARGLHETQKVFVVGYPYGIELGKEITVFSSTVSSLRKREDGTLGRVQLNGDMYPGNSGGPVVDTAGNVVGVAVAKILKTEINFAIPGDAVQQLNQGHIHNLELGDAVQRGSKIAVPVIINTLDPKKIITKIDCDWWLDEPDRKVLASATRPALPPGVSARQTLHVVSNPKSSALRAEIVLDAMPPAGKMLYVQPVLVNGKGKTSWLAARSVAVESPLRAQPVTFQARRLQGQVPVQLSCTSTFQLSASEKRKKVMETRITAQLQEETRPLSLWGTMPVRYTVTKLEAERSEDGRPQPVSAELRGALENSTQLVMTAQRDKQGGLGGKSSNGGSTRGEVKEELERLGDEMLQALDALAIKAPEGQVRPGQTWQANRQIPVPIFGLLKTGKLDVTYTYQGVRTHEGREVAVVALEGSVSSTGATLEGRARGKAVLDPATGQVLQAQASVHAALDVEINEVSVRAKGKLEVRATRGNVQPAPVPRD